MDNGGIAKQPAPIRGQSELYIPEVGLPIADYSALPTDLHADFQEMYERDVGLVAMHFLAEVFKTNRRGVERRRVVGISQTAIFIHTPKAVVLRCVAISALSQIYVHNDRIALKIPSEYDLLIRVGKSNKHRAEDLVEYMVEAILRLYYLAAPPNAPPVLVHRGQQWLAHKTAEQKKTAKQMLNFHRPKDWVPMRPVHVRVLPWRELALLPGFDAVCRRVLPERREMVLAIKEDIDAQAAKEAPVNPAPTPPEPPSTGSSGGEEDVVSAKQAEDIRRASLARTTSGKSIASVESYQSVRTPDQGAAWLINRPYYGLFEEMLEQQEGEEPLPVVRKVLLAPSKGTQTLPPSGWPEPLSPVYETPVKPGATHQSAYFPPHRGGSPPSAHRPSPIQSLIRSHPRVPPPPSTPPPPPSAPRSVPTPPYSPPPYRIPEGELSSAAIAAVIGVPPSKPSPLSPADPEAAALAEAVRAPDLDNEMLKAMQEAEALQASIDSLKRIGGHTLAAAVERSPALSKMVLSQSTNHVTFPTPHDRSDTPQLTCSPAPPPPPPPHLSQALHTPAPAPESPPSRMEDREESPAGSPPFSAKDWLGLLMSGAGEEGRRALREVLQRTVAMAATDGEVEKYSRLRKVTPKKDEEVGSALLSQLLEEQRRQREELAAACAKLDEVALRLSSPRTPRNPSESSPHRRSSRSPLPPGPINLYPEGPGSKVLPIPSRHGLTSYQRALRSSIRPLSTSPPRARRRPSGP